MVTIPEMVTFLLVCSYPGCHRRDRDPRAPRRRRAVMPGGRSGTGGRTGAGGDGRGRRGGQRQQPSDPRDKGKDGEPHAPPGHADGEGRRGEGSTFPADTPCRKCYCCLSADVHAPRSPVPGAPVCRALRARLPGALDGDHFRGGRLSPYPRCPCRIPLTSLCASAAPLRPCCVSRRGRGRRGAPVRPAWPRTRPGRRVGPGRLPRPRPR